MECKDCPMRLFEVRVYRRERVYGCRTRYDLIEDDELSPTWMLRETIDAANEQFANSKDLNDNARKVVETGTSRCVGYSKKDESYALSRNKLNGSSYGKVVIYEGEGTNAYSDNCSTKYRWIDTMSWKSLLEKYKDEDDDWY